MAKEKAKQLAQIQLEQLAAAKQRYAEQLEEERMVRKIVTFVCWVVAQLLFARSLFLVALTMIFVSVCVYATGG